VRQEANNSTRPLWMAVMLITAVLVAAAAAVFLHLAGASPASVVTAAGVSFATTMTLCFGAWKFLHS
jgi:hypothetical protein